MPAQKISSRLKAEFTLANLPIQHDERVVSQREEWYRMYRKGELTFKRIT